MTWDSGEKRSKENEVYNSCQCDISSDFFSSASSIFFLSVLLSFRTLIRVAMNYSLFFSLVAGFCFVLFNSRHSIAKAAYLQAFMGNIQFIDLNGPLYVDEWTIIKCFSCLRNEITYMQTPSHTHTLMALLQACCWPRLFFLKSKTQFHYSRSCVPV